MERIDSWGKRWWCRFVLLNLPHSVIRRIKAEKQTIYWLAHVRSNWSISWSTWCVGWFFLRTPLCRPFQWRDLPFCHCIWLMALCVDPQRDALDIYLFRKYMPTDREFRSDTVILGIQQINSRLFAWRGKNVSSATTWSTALVAHTYLLSLSAVVFSSRHVFIEIFICRLYFCLVSDSCGIWVINYLAFNSHEISQVWIWFTRESYADWLECFVYRSYSRI